MIINRRTVPKNLFKISLSNSQKTASQNTTIVCLHLISPYSNTAKSFIEIIRIKEMITTNVGSFYCQMNSHQYHGECVEKIMENIETDVRM